MLRAEQLVLQLEKSLLARNSNSLCLPIRSWLLYVLVLASLSLSILVFWLSLYKSQEAGMAVRALREEQNETVAKLVDARLAELRGERKSQPVYE